MPTAPAPGVVINTGMNLLSRLGSPAIPGSTCLNLILYNNILI